MTNDERSAATKALHAAMAVAVLPKLKVGELVPSCDNLGFLFRLSPDIVSAHLREVLDEAGVVVESVDGPGPVHRLAVVSMPEAGV